MAGHVPGDAVLSEPSEFNIRAVECRRAPATDGGPLRKRSAIMGSDSGPPAAPGPQVEGRSAERPRRRRSFRG